MNSTWLVGLAGVAGVATAISASADSTPPPEQDSELWSRICGSGDVLLGSTFESSVLSDPLKVDALLWQRVVRPLFLLCLRMVRPWVSVEEMDAQLHSAWAERNERLRQSGCLNVEGLASSLSSAWKNNNRILVDSMKVGTPESDRAREAMRANLPSIRSAFSECRQICNTAACIDEKNACCWLQICAVIDNMEAVVNHLSGGSASFDPDISADLGVQTEEVHGDSDRFGAVSVDEDSFGQWEEFIVSGHRAPSVGLGQYRRMGGRVF